MFHENRSAGDPDKKNKLGRIYMYRWIDLTWTCIAGNGVSGVSCHDESPNTAEHNPHGNEFNLVLLIVNIIKHQYEKKTYWLLDSGALSMNFLLHWSQHHVL